MAPPKNPSELAADAVVHAYLRGRTMPAILHGAIVWAVEMRISRGKLPLLDETLTNDIDNHAVWAPAYTVTPIQPVQQPSSSARPDATAKHGLKSEHTPNMCDTVQTTLPSAAHDGDTPSESKQAAFIE